MFKNISLVKKIIFGFLSILILILTVGLISYIELNQTSEGFNRYRKMARDTNLAGRLQANLLMMRITVKDYIKTGSSQSFIKYEEYAGNLQEFIKEAQQEIKNPGRAAMIDEIDEGSKKYEEAFQKVLVLKKQRNQIVNEILNIKGPAMETTLTEIMTSAFKDEDSIAAYHTGLAMRHLLLGRLYMVKFLETNQYSDTDRVNDEFARMQQTLDILDKELENPARRKLLALVIEAKNEYKKSGILYLPVYTFRQIKFFIFL